MYGNVFFNQKPTPLDTFSHALPYTRKPKKNKSCIMKVKKFETNRHPILGVDCRHLSRFAVFWIVFMLSSGQIWRDQLSRKNSEGNELYQQKSYPKALDKYVQAQDGQHHQQELSYNLANTLYQQKKYAEAIKEYDKAASFGESKLKENIHYNKGNAFFQAGKFAESVESYKKALELDPNDLEAKYNLELALQKMQENPQQKESQNKENQSTDKDKSGSRQNRQNDSQEEKNKQAQQQQNEPQQQQKDRSNPSQEKQQQGQAKPERETRMDSKQALQILDALNQQEKQEQRKQALKVQRAPTKGKDW
jgi:tetratricopeptide (TPR) repeat protein